MKQCACGVVITAETASFDKTKPDGLANRCHDCNRAKCRRWYDANRSRKIEATQAYKQTHRQSASTTKTERSKRTTTTATDDTRTGTQETQSVLCEIPLVRLTEAEMEHCIISAHRLGLTVSEYIRSLITQAMTG